MVSNTLGKLFGALLCFGLAACGQTGIRNAMITPEKNLSRPSRILVYDFAVSEREVTEYQGIMNPTNRFIVALSKIPIADGVVANSIVGVEGGGPPAEGGDGVVKYSSAHIEGVESEKIVNSPHSMQGNPETIQEVKRILLKHANSLP